MFSNIVKAMMMGGVFIFTLSLFSLTESGANMASAITGIDTQIDKCMDNLPDNKKESVYIATKARLNADSKKDIILKATAGDQCGSAGCAHELCLVTGNDTEIIPFGYAAETLVVKDSLSNGMRDIQLTGKSTTNLTWDGTRYTVVNN